MSTDHQKTVFAEWLSQELKRRGWSQAEFSRRSGVDRQRISEYLRGLFVPDARMAQLIADGLGVSASVVLIKTGKIESELMYDPEGDRQQLVALINRVNLDDPGTTKMIRRVLEGVVADQQNED